MKKNLLKKVFFKTFAILSLGLLVMQSANVVAQSRTINAKHTTTVPVVDGLVDDVWAYADSADIDTTGWNWGVNNSNSDDFVTKIKVLWNDNSLYLLVQQTDDELVVDDIGWLAGDLIQISMDVNNTNATDFSNSGYFWGIRPGVNKSSSELQGRSPGQVIEGEPWTAGEISFFSIVDSVMIEDFWTYYTTLEVEFALKADLGLIKDLAKEDTVGFDIRFEDRESTGASTWSFNQTEGWNDPSGNGNVAISDEEAIPTSVISLNDGNIKVFPNPVSDILFIQNIASVQNIELFNIQGKSILKQSLNGKGEINMSNLHSGIYIIKVSSNGNSSFSKIVKK